MVAYLFKSVHFQSFALGLLAAFSASCYWWNRSSQGKPIRSKLRSFLNFWVSRLFQVSDLFSITNFKCFFSAGTQIYCALDSSAFIVEKMFVFLLRRLSFLIKYFITPFFRQPKWKDLARIHKTSCRSASCSQR